MPNTFRKSKVLRNHFNLTNKTKNPVARHELVEAKRANRNLPRTKNWFRGNEHLSILSSNLETDQVLRICVVRSKGGIGDVLMTTPLLKSIKLRHPRCKLTYATDKLYAGGALFDVLQGNPYIDSLIPMSSFNKEDYHFHVDVTPTGLSRERKGMPVPNRIDMFAEAAGVKLIDTKPTCTVTEKEKIWAKEMMSKWGRGKKLQAVTVHISSVDQRRNWPAKHFMELVGRLSKLRPDLLFIIFDQHKKGTWGLRRSANASQYSIRAKAALINESILFIGPDSGLMHIAGALEKDMVTLFGSTDANSRINHYRNAVSVEAGVVCSPCWYAPCLLNYACMRQITVSKVLVAVLDKLSERLLPRELVDSGALFIESDQNNSLVPKELTSRFDMLFASNIGNREAVAPTVGDHVLEVVDTKIGQACRLDPRTTSSALILESTPGELSTGVFNKLKTYRKVYVLSTWAKTEIEKKLVANVEVIKAPMKPSVKWKSLQKDSSKITIGSTTPFYKAFFKDYNFIVSSDIEELIDKCDVYLESDPYLFNTYPLLTAFRAGLIVISPVMLDEYGDPSPAFRYVDIEPGLSLGVNSQVRENGEIYYTDFSLKKFAIELPEIYEEALLNTTDRISFFKKEYESVADINRMIREALVVGA